MRKPEMYPPPGERLLRFVGDRTRFALRPDTGEPLPGGWTVFLRTNLGRSARVRQEIIQSYTSKLPSAGAAWRDIPMRRTGSEWSIELPLVEVGYFRAKAYMVDPAGRQFWPDGPDLAVTVHPDQYRTGNTIYCAFVRMFGETRTGSWTVNERLEAQLAKLDKQGYSVIPPSGKIRDLVRALPHIVDKLGCRIVHLLPVSPTPTTYARFGRFGSPYASLDLMAVDPALVEFDRRTTGIDQFRELTYAAHLAKARVFLDIVTNHTGWGSTLQENHPEWFLRGPDARFGSPGAWGVTWEDLVELDHRNPASWEHLAEVFLTWCRRGVDGFRCDAGYKVPMPAWRYITACVREEFPETIFLLEGLGGSWEATESLLTDGGMQWAYSELFQNYSGSEVAKYLEHAHRQSERVGLYVHYSETHDNDRLAKKGRTWSLLRNRLCGLASTSGGYGFTCGVEWLATESVDVHCRGGLSWDSPDNIVTELATINQLLANHPCFLDNAKLSRLSSTDSAVYALRRDSEQGEDRVLVLVNTDDKDRRSVTLDEALWNELGRPGIDLLGQEAPLARVTETGQITFTLPAGACYCLAVTQKPIGLTGAEYRRVRACAAVALQALSHNLAIEEIGSFSWRALAALFEQDPKRFLAALGRLDRSRAQQDLVSAFDEAFKCDRFPEVVAWELSDVSRVTLVPPGHWLVIRDDYPFRASLSGPPGRAPQHLHSIQAKGGHVVCFPPQSVPRTTTLLLERYAPAQNHLEAQVQFLTDTPVMTDLRITRDPKSGSALRSVMVLLTNGRGGMARICSDLGRIRSKYDCLLGANLHPNVPVDRHVFAKRLRAWLIADRFLSPLDQYNLTYFAPGPPAHWRFLANAGDGRVVEVHLDVDMLEEQNTTVVRFSRPVLPPPCGSDLPHDCEVRLTVRIDLEDRNFHWETRRNGGTDHHFTTHTRALSQQIGFQFTPAADRALRVYSDCGEYHPEPEWSENIHHPNEQSRGQADRGDAYSPGWFDLPLGRGTSATLVLCAEPVDPNPDEVRRFKWRREAANQDRTAMAKLPDDDAFGLQLALAAHQFVVRRGGGKTVIAGYPWFLDWGRDTLICARGLLAAGLVREVRQSLVTFARFEQNGTLPNNIYGEDASNRDTSDAPLWFGLACEEAARADSPESLEPEFRAQDPGPTPLYDQVVDDRRRTVREVLRSIAEGYLRGTPNGIHVDTESGLVWSPTHFTWMDTNFPASTPREGYPVELQALWIRLLRQLARVDTGNTLKWEELASRAQASFLRLFWIPEKGYLADCILAGPGQKASSGTLDSALRSNCLFAISLGLLSGEPARRCVEAARKYLLVPGALRSLAPLAVSPPLPIRSRDGRLLNNPNEPYWGRYEGDEDTRRKPAYHNGTAWTWTLPTFCEALVLAWDSQPEAVRAAQAYLSSLGQLLTEGCLGQIPELVDGDAPHAQRGCDAQAWGVTEALRVWKWFGNLRT